ncbi:MAG: TetR/AcrR family transcriptional regulator [Lachnospiraceae bacterium]|nr:TetR/AcrR family transcriptional regulator [Lachnospiraceae bacterium]
MENKAYHHGNLQEALMEEGIAMIHEEGAAQFSLRKLAKRVGVSPTACYNHYQNVEDLQKSMRQYVTDRFCNALKQVVEMNIPNPREGTLRLGMAYVSFFASNPHYFSYIFDSGEYHIHLTDTDMNGDYEPFNIFKNYSLKCMKACGIPESHYRDNLIVMWGTVHGLAAMANMKAVSFDGDWAQLTATILKSKLVIQ